MSINDSSGNGDENRYDVIVRWISENGKLRGKELEELFKKRFSTKSGNNVYRYLKKLKSEKPPSIETTIIDEETYYHLPGQRPKNSPPSEVDRLILNELKSIVVEVMASGLLELSDEGNGKLREKRTLLLRRCESLRQSVRWLQMNRDLIIEGWWRPGIHVELEGGLSVWKTPAEGDMKVWLYYLLGAIDAMSRMLSGSTETI